MTIKSMLYKALALSNDIEAARRGRLGQRLLRRIYGRLTGRLARRLFR